MLFTNCLKNNDCDPKYERRSKKAMGKLVGWVVKVTIAYFLMEMQLDGNWRRCARADENRIKKWEFRYARWKKNARFSFLSRHSFRKRRESAQLRATSVIRIIIFLLKRKIEVYVFFRVLGCAAASCRYISQSRLLLLLFTNFCFK